MPIIASSAIFAASLAASRAGHGAGRSTTQLIEEVTDQWSFLVRELGMDATHEVAADVPAGASAR